MWTFVLLLTALISTILLTLRFLSLIVKTAIVAVALTLFSTIATVVFLTVSVLLLVTVIALICLRRSACSLARASRSALKLRLCGLAATFSVLGALAQQVLPLPWLQLV